MANGSVTINRRKYAIYWSGEIAQHVCENYHSDRVNHPVLHVAIQQMLVRSEIRPQKKRHTYAGFYQHSYQEGKPSFRQAKGGTYVIFFTINSKAKLANIRTCYYMPMSKAKAKQQRGLSGTKREAAPREAAPREAAPKYQYEKLDDYPKQIRWKPKVLNKMVNEGLYDSVEEAKRFLLEGVNHKSR